MLFSENINNITKESDIYKYITNTKNNLNTSLETQNIKKTTLMQFLDIILDMQVDTIDSIDTNELILIAENIKESLDGIRNNIENYNNLLVQIKDIISKLNNLIENNKNDSEIIKNINYFYPTYLEKQYSIEKNNIKYEQIISKIYKTIFLTKVNEKEEHHVTENTEEKQEDKQETQNSNQETENQLEPQEQDIPKTQISEKEFTDNDVLLISEMKNKVFLPYKIYDLKEILEKNPDKYLSIQDLIDKEYTIDLNKYKNAIFSRFREAYHLMKDKENASFTEALDLALEVAFKYNLNPAIITACKNLDEFDVYLDCLEENNLDDFKIFNIKYEIAPTKI